MSDAQEVLKRLPRLSKAELEQVRQRVAFLAGPQASRRAEGEDWLLSAFLSELSGMGMVSASRSPKLLGVILPQDYAERSAPVREHLLKGFTVGVSSYTHKLALGRLAASALVDYLRRAKVPVSPKTLFANVDKVPQALEDAFPGYWRAQLLGACMRQKVAS